VSGHQRWIIIGTYMSPNDDPAEHIRDITNTRNQYPDIPPIIVGDFNANINNPTTQRDVELSTLAAALQVRDPIHIFKQKRNRKYSWHMKYTGRRTMKSRCDYVMTPYQQRIIDAKFSSPAPFDTDHQAVWTAIPGADADEHQSIQKRRSKMPAIKATCNNERITNSKLQLLTKHKARQTPPEPINARTRSWISLDTWKTIDQRHYL